MRSRDIEVSPARQIKSTTGVTVPAWVCLLVLLLLSLAMVGWVTWEVRLVHPLAFLILAGLMAPVLYLMTAVIVVEIAGRWWRRGHSSSTTSASLRSNPFVPPFVSASELKCCDQPKRSIY